jgi:hypothetical protein
MCVIINENYEDAEKDESRKGKLRIKGRTR